MSRPDPATDFVGSIKWLMDKIESWEKYVANGDEKRVSALAAARLLGYSRQYFYKPWRRPNFSASGSLHTISEWRRWVEEKTDRERHAEYDRINNIARKRREARATA